MILYYERDFKFKFLWKEFLFCADSISLYYGYRVCYYNKCCCIVRTEDCQGDWYGWYSLAGLVIQDGLGFGHTLLDGLCEDKGCLFMVDQDADGLHYPYIRVIKLLTKSM